MNARLTFEIPESTLVILVGAAGSGKSTFAREHFLSTEILSSDAFRAMVSDDEGDQQASGDAFALLHLVLEMRLRRGKMCVVDATNVRAEDRVRLLARAVRFDRTAVAIVFETPEIICIERATSRTERIVNAEIVRMQLRDLPREPESLLSEGFAQVFRIEPTMQVEIQRC